MNSSPLLIIIPQQNRDLHTIPVEKKQQQEAENPQKLEKPSCVHVKLDDEYLICDQRLQRMHRKSSTVFKMCSGHRARSGGGVCGELTG